tara:strand:+ start:200 stop:691 length:492 start_codon:yes stop_codon:yes gene_type:complete
MIIDAIIEIPLNSNIKYEYDEKHDKLRCDRIMNTSMIYPGNYGYIPNTLAGDGDPLDILVLCDYSINPGIIIECKIIGVLIMKDEKGLDEKIIAIPSNNVDINSEKINNLDDLQENLLSKIYHFFQHYKDNDKNKWTEIKEHKIRSKIYAENLIHKYKINSKL